MVYLVQNVPNGNRGATGRAAKTFQAAVGNSDFNAVIFGHVTTNGVTEATQAKVLSAAIGIIDALSAQYDAGNMSEAARNAKRLKDTIDAYDMPRY